jgi:hypothetical protein
MPTPFPGMDPYLEQPELWPDIHNSLISALRNDLAPKLRSRYYLAIEERLYLAKAGSLVEWADMAVMGRPQAAAPASPALEIDPGNAVVIELPMPDQIRETFLEVRETDSNKVITVVEILLPTNKRPGPGRNLYLQKRAELLAGQTHLIEIDLLRAWEPMPMRQVAPQAHYWILVSRAEQRPRAHLFPFSIRQPIPTFALPLQLGDQEPTVNLGHLLHALYDRAGYDLRLDYGLEPPPPLAEEDVAWVEGLLRQAGLR